MSLGITDVAIACGGDVTLVVMTNFRINGSRMDFDAKLDFWDAIHTGNQDARTRVIHKARETGILYEMKVRYRDSTFFLIDSELEKLIPRALIRLDRLKKEAPSQLW